jgi:hypothetical protein
MKFIQSKITLILSAFIFLQACKSGEIIPSVSSLTPAATAFGNVNQLVVVADQPLWEGPIGDSVRYLFESAYPILPQPEPLFDIRYLPYEDVIGIKTKRELRNYLFVANFSTLDTAAKKLLYRLLGTERLNDHLSESEYSNLISQDIWAKGQQFLYLIGKNEVDLLARLKKSFPGLSRQIRNHDNEMIYATAYAAGEAKGINADILQRYGIQLKIPADWKVALDKKQGTWLRKETDKASFNLLLSKIKYANTTQFTVDGLKLIRDSLATSFVRTDSPGDKMLINDKDLPLFLYPKNVDNHYGVELRGIWETKIEYMGGPFQTYVFQAPAKDSLMVIDAFLYAPEQEKRDLIQQLEAIVNSFRFQ